MPGQTHATDRILKILFLLICFVLIIFGLIEGFRPIEYVTRSWHGGWGNGLTGHEIHLAVLYEKLQACCLVAWSLLALILFMIVRVRKKVLVTLTFSSLDLTLTILTHYVAKWSDYIFPFHFLVLRGLMDLTLLFLSILVVID